MDPNIQPFACGANDLTQCATFTAKETKAFVMQKNPLAQTLKS